MRVRLIAQIIFSRQPDIIKYGLFSVNIKKSVDNFSLTKNSSACFKGAKTYFEEVFQFEENSKRLSI